MIIYDKTKPAIGKPTSFKGGAEGLLRMAKAWETLSVHGGHIDWHNGEPKIIVDAAGSGLENAMPFTVTYDSEDGKVDLAAGHVYVGQTEVSVTAQSWAISSGGTVSVEVNLAAATAAKTYPTPTAMTGTLQVVKIADITSEGVVTQRYQGDIYIDLF